MRWGFGVWLGLLPGIEDGAGAGLNSGLCSSWVCEAEKMALLCLLCTQCKGSRNDVTRQGPCRIKCDGLCGQLPASGTLWELKPVLALEWFPDLLCASSPAGLLGRVGCYLVVTVLHFFLLFSFRKAGDNPLILY